ncbi:Spy/CpxP family protein refolding chaperone [bacterium SCSIO 12696]|nr:Spy/CpxP family protein refolding chaperone [bacterium SCSIO 12696]
MKTLQATGIALALVGAFTISTATLAESGKGGKHRGHHAEHTFKRMAKHLNLDQSQREQARAIHEEMRPQMRELKKESREVRKALGEAVRNGASQAEIEALAAQQGELHGQLVAKRAEMKGRIHDLLTDEQKQQLEEHRQKRMERKQQRREKIQQRREERQAQQEEA